MLKKPNRKAKDIHILQQNSRENSQVVFVTFLLFLFVTLNVILTQKKLCEKPIILAI